MELLNGRPSDTAGRLEKEIRVYDLLESPIRESIMNLQ